MRVELFPQQAIENNTAKSRTHKQTVLYVLKAVTYLPFVSCNFMSCNFMPCNFDVPSFSCPSFSAPPLSDATAEMSFGDH